MWFGYLTWERGEYVCAAFSLMQHEQEENNRWGFTLHCTTAKSNGVGYTEDPRKSKLLRAHPHALLTALIWKLHLLVYKQPATDTVATPERAKNFFHPQKTMGGLAEKYVNLGFCTFYFQRKAEGSGIILPEYSVLGWELLKSI